MNNPMRPLCFVLMPFGKKPDGQGGMIDFDAVYRDIFAPGIEAAGLEPLRADEEQAGGIIHKPMFERLILCEYAVADLSTANPNVFYELGLRHAARSHSTVLTFCEGMRLPFDVNGLRGLGYGLSSDGLPARAADDAERLTRMLIAAREQQFTDSPLYQLVEDYPDVQHAKTDVFRDRVAYSQQTKQQLAQARAQGLAALREVHAGLGELMDVEAGVLVDLLLSYRDLKAWKDMVSLVAAMPRPLADTVLVQEQLGLALNRDKQHARAEQVLLALIQARGTSSETCGILGRVYQDQWEAACQAGDDFLARGLLDKAIRAYLQGFEADWRDAYPGINAVTLMTLKQPPDPRHEKLLPVVRFAVEQRLKCQQPDYWDHATLLELAVLAVDQPAAETAAADALAVLRASWEAETTARNLRLIRQARAARNQQHPWADQIEAYFSRKGS